MLTTTLLIVTAAASGAAEDAQPVATATKPTFAAPVRLKADGEWIAVEAPGYAAPALHDLNDDGRKDLVVGQFNDGKMMAYPRNEDGSFGAGSWIQAEGETAKVPGVW